jgi:hypothetical protein
MLPATYNGGGVPARPSDLRYTGRMPGGMRGIGSAISGLLTGPVGSFARRLPLLGPLSGVLDAVTNSTPANQGEIPVYIRGPNGDYVKNPAFLEKLATGTDTNPRVQGFGDEKPLANSFPPMQGFGDDPSTVPLPRSRPTNLGAPHAGAPLSLAPPNPGPQASYDPYGFANSPAYMGQGSTPGNSSDLFRALVDALKAK